MVRNIDLWEKVLKGMPSSYNKWFKKEKRYLTKNITKDSTVLEVGCGEGRSLNDIIEVTKNIIGIDHDKKIIKVARKNFKKYPKVKILFADARKLPFKANSFDFVICMTTFANFEDYKIKALKEMKRVVKDAGFIIISVYSEDAFSERLKVYKKFKMPIKEIKGTTVIFYEEIGDNISEQFSKNQLIKIFNKAKLKIIEIKKVGMAYICKLRK